MEHIVQFGIGIDDEAIEKLVDKMSRTKVIKEAMAEKVREDV